MKKIEYSQSTTRYLRLSGPPSGQGAGGGARTRDRRVHADLRADSLVTVPPTYGIQTHKFWKKVGVHGPSPVPFFGNIPELFDPAVGFRAAARRWQELYGRVFGIYFFRKPVLVVTDPEVIKQILIKDFNVFVDRFFVGEGKLQNPLLRLTVFFAQGSTWRRLRKMMTPSFSGAKLRFLTSRVNKMARQLGDYLHNAAVEGRPLEAKWVFGAYILDISAAMTFGLDLDSLNNLEGPFTQHAKSLVTIDRPIQIKLTLAGIFPALLPILQFFNIGYFKYSDVCFFRDNLKALVRERVKQGESRDDFLQLFLEAEFKATKEDGSYDCCSKLSEDEIVAQALLFIIAGYDGSSGALQYLYYQLAKHQDVQTKILQEILEEVGEDQEPTYENCQNLSYTEAAIEETLRMYPPVLLLLRNCTKDTTLGEISVASGTGVIIPAYNVGRDPELFPNPDEFQPERFLGKSRLTVNPASFLPFGLGPRQCIGLRFAMLQIKVALVYTLRSVAVVSATPEVLETEDFTGVLTPKVPINLFLAPRDLERY
ncbi:cytochrome p450 [Plakobranchus ocellatus]|uniref:Cytochrome p450 n=1 Tax=Plakobranchus ocellatus TaxID=259542 RepID=A0AAV3YPS7_9GAST|nr:cytochrome p450 [Plakobranchus ocellatus]